MLGCLVTYHIIVILALGSHFVSEIWKVHLLAEMSVELDYSWALEMETWKAVLYLENSMEYE